MPCIRVFGGLGPMNKLVAEELAAIPNSLCIHYFHLSDSHSLSMLSLMYPLPPTFFQWPDAL